MSKRTPLLAVVLRMYLMKETPEILTILIFRLSLLSGVDVGNIRSRQNLFLSEKPIKIEKYRDEEGKERFETLIVFRADEPKYIFFDGKQWNISSYGWSFDELLAKEAERLNIDIVHHNFFSPGDINLFRQGDLMKNNKQVKNDEKTL